MNILSRILNPKPKEPEAPTMESYGQPSSGLTMEQIQPVMEWLGLSLYYAGHLGTSHIIWYNSENYISGVLKAAKIGLKKGEMVFLFRCGKRVHPAPDGYYWRMMPEHGSMKLYQLEFKEP